MIGVGFQGGAGASITVVTLPERARSTGTLKAEDRDQRTRKLNVPEGSRSPAIRTNPV